MSVSKFRPGFAGLALVVCALAAAAARADGALPRPGAASAEPPPSAASAESRLAPIHERTSVPRLENSAAQLAHASSLRSAMRGKEAAEKASARTAAVEAYRAVREYFPEDPRACAEAAFRAGELLRAANDPAALDEFQIAREKGAATPFRARAGLEIAHVHRRASRYGDSLAAYESVIADTGATPRQRDDAAYWTGHVYAAEKRVGDARRVWQRVAGTAEDPLDRIRAFDCIALSYVEAGDPEAAAGVLETCREALAEAAAEETRLGERVRGALSTMRALDELQRAVQERDRARTVDERPAADGTREPDRSGERGTKKNLDNLFLPTARAR